MSNGMMNRALRIAFFLFGLCSVSLAHEARRGAVIVDTDMALDDARAIALLACAPGVELIAVLASDGGSSPCDGASRVQRLLGTLDQVGVPVGVGKPLGKPTPPWRELAAVLDELGSAEGPGCDALPGAVNLALKALTESDSLVTWVALGPMSNLASLLERHPGVRTRLHAVYYSGDRPEAERPGWNTARDPEAAATVFAAGVPIYLVPPAEAEAGLALNSDLLEAIGAFDSPAAQWISRLHANARVRRLAAEGHAGPWDDTVVLALLEPSAFGSTVVRDSPPLRRLVPSSPDAMRHALFRGLAADEGLSSRPNVVLRHLPTESSALREDIAEVAEDILKRHGSEEWEAALLTNELHRHLGIYSLVGAKMGIRARESLHASLDDLRVESHAGLKPPMSCLNDGLQVATGATLGRGAIRVEGDPPVAEAVFFKGEAQLRLALKDDVRDQIRRDVAVAEERFGPLTPEYFDEIRRLSIRYWLELDRREIFEEVSRSKP